MLRKLILVLTLCSISALTGCASIVNGTHQSVSVHNGQIEGATCSLSNNKGQWFINRTPGSVVINRSFDDLQISCKKRGYQIGNQRIASHTKALAFGNAIFGGVIGAGVDIADGAAYDYPTSIYIPLHRA
jgi:uncharacterized protein YceK